MSIDDQFCAIFYLISQNRIKQAKAIFTSIDSKQAKKQSAMMYDYVSTFLAFFEKDQSKALEKHDTCHKWLAVSLPTTRKNVVTS